MFILYGLHTIYLYYIRYFVLCTFFCYFSGIFFRYIGYFAKNVNFPKKFFVLGLISWYILEIPRRSFHSLCRNDRAMSGFFLFWVLFSTPIWNGGVEVVFISTFLRGTYWRFLLEPSGFSVGMTYCWFVSHGSYSRFLVGRSSLARNDRAGAMFSFEFYFPRPFGITRLG